MTTPAISTRIEAGTWAIEPTDWTVGFSVQQLGLITVRGEFTKFSGTLTIPEAGAPSVRVDIAVDSITTGNDRRDRDLRSAAFFDVDTYPAATFVTTEQPSEVDSGQQPSEHALAGELTVKGISRPVVLTIAPIADYRPGDTDSMIDVRAQTTLHRSDFGVGPRNGLIIGDAIVVAVAVRLHRS
ncbi:YceI family protein [Gordonia sp. CPCC 205515]|uniref:YceI family protein n=1 Tax=Gordonia sp. CPCC 205515 TaxID=3140791 RepID=UPI003AF3367B